MSPFRQARQRTLIGKFSWQQLSTLAWTTLARTQRHKRVYRMPREIVRLAAIVAQKGCIEGRALGVTALPKG